MSDIFDLSGKTAVITGGAGRIGASVSRALADHGASVAVVDIDSASAEALASEITAATGRSVIGVGCDVASPRSVEDMVARVTKELGEIHILHNNAATQTDRAAFFAPFENYDLDTWREVMSVNLDGMFLVAKTVGGAMAAQRSGGSIVQTTSIYGITAPDQRIYENGEVGGHSMSLPAVYATSKAAIIGLTRYLATYWADAGIRVNALAPGGIGGDVNAEFEERYTARVPLGRMAHVDDLIGAMVFLASDSSSYMTGQTLVVDGGWTIW